MMVFHPEPHYVPQVFEVSAGILRDFKNFKYLGYKVSSENGFRFLENQISAAWAAFNRERTAFTCQKIPIKIRVDLFQSLVVSILCYFVQVWCLRQTE